jgi:hypothetical protein
LHAVDLAVADLRREPVAHLLVRERAARADELRHLGIAPQAEGEFRIVRRPLRKAETLRLQEILPHLATPPSLALMPGVRSAAV